MPESGLRAHTNGRIQVPMFKGTPFRNPALDCQLWN
jgi:hypothetical protein